MEQGALAGAVRGHAGDCLAKVDDVVDQLLGGRMSDGLEVDCAITGGLMVATASVTFDSWTPITPEFDLELRSRAVIELLP